MTQAIDYTEIIKEKFNAEQIDYDLEVKNYPEETIFIVRVDSNDYIKAASLGNEIDSLLASSAFKGFITVRKREKTTISVNKKRLSGVSDPRASELASLLTARSRASESQPSLNYIKDVAQNLSAALAPRHHLIFGRRGSGKTALMVEAKKQLEQKDSHIIWVNIQTHRHEPSAYRVFLFIIKKITESIQVYYRNHDNVPKVFNDAISLEEKLDRDINRDGVSEESIKRLIPHIHQLISRFINTIGQALYIFIDDFHYFKRAEQPLLLDLLHSCVRDSDAWMKVAAIRHLSKWFNEDKQLGLQTGHDADHIDLDVTLQNPKEAKDFLEKVLYSYAEHISINTVKSVFSSKALDRLVLASGAVPRDYLVLCARSIRIAQTRGKAKLVGGQDVNRAAGDNADVKTIELEEDAASTDQQNKIILALNKIKKFCIQETRYTYFRINWLDKEQQLESYSLMQDLLDLRLLHLLHRGISDERIAGQKSEVLMIDLSQFSVHRLRRKLRVLDFDDGYFVLKETGSASKCIIGNTPNKLLGLLRRAPLFQLLSLIDPKK